MLLSAAFSAGGLQPYVSQSCRPACCHVHGSISLQTAV